MPYDLKVCLTRSCGPDKDEDRILVFKEKHGERYFSAATHEQIGRACLKILKERLKEGWYGTDEKGIPPLELELAQYEEDLKGVKHDLCQKDVQNRIDNVKHEIEWKKMRIKFFIQTKEVVKRKDWRQAWWLIWNRRDGEYEGAEIIHLEAGEAK